jgi:hypothetical protein
VLQAANICSGQGWQGRSKLKNKTQKHRIQAARPSPLKEPRKEEANSPVSDMVPPYHGGPVGISDFFPARDFKGAPEIPKFPPFHSSCSRGRGCLVLSAFRLPRIIESVALRLGEVAVLLMKVYSRCRGQCCSPVGANGLLGRKRMRRFLALGGKGGC